MTDCGLVDDGISHSSYRRYDEDEMGRIALDKNHILVGCTGSVASLLTPRLVEELASLKYNVCETYSQYKHMHNSHTHSTESSHVHIFYKVPAFVNI